jgi:hypothetical protein
MWNAKFFGHDVIKLENTVTQEVLEMRVGSHPEWLQMLPKAALDAIVNCQANPMYNDTIPVEKNLDSFPNLSFDIEEKEVFKDETTEKLYLFGGNID